MTFCKADQSDTEGYEGYADDYEKVSESISMLTPREREKKKKSEI